MDQQTLDMYMAEEATIIKLDWGYNSFRKYFSKQQKKRNEAMSSGYENYKKKLFEKLGSEMKIP